MDHFLCGSTVGDTPRLRYKTKPPRPFDKCLLTNQHSNEQIRLENLDDRRPDVFPPKKRSIVHLRFNYKGNFTVNKK